MSNAKIVLTIAVGWFLIGCNVQFVQPGKPAPALTAGEDEEIATLNIIGLT